MIDNNVFHLRIGIVLYVFNITTLVFVCVVALVVYPSLLINSLLLTTTASLALVGILTYIKFAAKINPFTSRSKIIEHALENADQPIVICENTDVDGTDTPTVVFANSSYLTSINKTIHDVIGKKPVLDLLTQEPVMVNGQIQYWIDQGKRRQTQSIK